MLNDSSKLVGRVLGGCKLKELIGQGGNALVFRAWQENLSRDVAVKVLRLQRFVDSDLHNNFLARFQQEASVIAAFDHINILSIHDFGIQDGLAYLVMPLLSQGSLRDILNRRGSLSLQESLIYITQAASALDYAHAHRVIHRDLKPANFLVHNDGRLILADFGIAHLMKESMIGLTNTGVLLGTPEYMAPEMIDPEMLRGQHVDHRADIYELGIVLYQMLSGGLPFEDESTYTILWRQVHERLPLLHSRHPFIPVAVDEVIQKATAKNRDERFTSAGGLARALRTAILPSPLTKKDANNAQYAQTIFPFYKPSQSAQAAQAAQAAHSFDAQTVPDAVPNNEGPKAPVAHTVVAPAAFSAAETTSKHRKRRKRPFFKRSPFLLTAFLLMCIIVVSVPLFIARPTKGSAASRVQLNHAPMPTPIPTPTYDTQKAVVVDFYRALKERDYATAYKHLLNAGETNANSDAYCTFVQGYLPMIDNAIKIDGATLLNDGTNSVQVDITIIAIEVGSQGKTQRSVYQQFQVIRDGQIVRGGNRNHNRNGIIQGPTIIAVPQAVTTPDPGNTSPLQVIQEEYDYINRKDYQKAYSLWSMDYQKNTSFCSFLLSNVRPQAVTMQSGGTSYQDDGTSSVRVTVTETIAGTEGTPYSKTYFVARSDDNTLRITKAT